MKLLEVIALIFLGVIALLLLIGSFILPEHRIRNEVSRIQYGYMMKAVLWGSIYIVVIDFFIMTVLILIGQS